MNPMDSACSHCRGRHHERPASRREFLARGGAGFGGLALTHLLSQEAGAANLLHAKPGPRRASAKSVIFLFMEGGPSHLDLFDPKPLLNQLAGTILPESFGTVITPMGESRSPLLACRRTWKKRGQSGLWISDWLPRMAKHVDDFCVLRSCWTNGLNHVVGVGQMNTGAVQSGRPSLGSWISYGLGSANEDLPAFAVLTDNGKLPLGGHRNWGGGFMPGTFDGVKLEDGDQPIPHLANAPGVSDQEQQAKLDLLQDLNREHGRNHPQSDELEARISAYELAFRMQAAAPEAVDVDRESDAVKTLYGMDRTETRDMARSCILARRLVERGVRFVQVYCGAGSKWDAHTDIEGNHSGLCRAMDQPVSALLTDLKARGLLEETLVIWGGEFGRTPMSEKGNGRDHNPYGFTMVLAGGGVKGGQTIGRTDDLGLRAVEDKIHVRDLHATIMHALGLNHLELRFANNGRMENATMNEGAPVLKAFS